MCVCVCGGEVKLIDTGGDGSTGSLVCSVLIQDTTSPEPHLASL